MARRLSPSAALTSVENALCMIRLDLPDLDFDEGLCRTLHSLYAPFVDIPGGRETLFMKRTPASEVCTRRMMKITLSLPSLNVRLLWLLVLHYVR
jgi:hypothetical protein